MHVLIKMRYYITLGLETAIGLENIFLNWCICFHFYLQLQNIFVCHHVFSPLRLTR